MPALAKKHISPHSFRHAAGVMLVAAGTDVTIIRSFLGHQKLDTFMRERTSRRSAKLWKKSTRVRDLVNRRAGGGTRSF
jgi:integrase